MAYWAVGRTAVTMMWHEADRGLHELEMKLWDEMKYLRVCTCVGGSVRELAGPARFTKCRVRLVAR